MGTLQTWKKRPPNPSSLKLSSSAQNGQHNLWRMRGRIRHFIVFSGAAFITRPQTKGILDFLFQFLDDLPQLFEFKRLSDNLIHVHFLVSTDVAWRQMSRNEDDLAHILPLAQLPHQLQPARTRHPMIG